MTAATAVASTRSQSQPETFSTVQTGFSIVTALQTVKSFPQIGRKYFEVWSDRQ